MADRQNVSDIDALLWCRQHHAVVRFEATGMVTVFADGMLSWVTADSFVAAVAGARAALEARQHGR